MSIDTAMSDWVESAEQILLYCRNNQKRSIAFVALRPDADVPACAHGIAAVANQSGYRPILIDLSQFEAGSSTEVAPADSDHPRMTSIVSDLNPYATVEVKVSENSKYYFNNLNWLRNEINKTIGNYDFALICLPPIMDRNPLAINPMSSLSVCDCALMVCEPGIESGEQVREGLEQIRVTGGKIDGIVLVQPKSKGRRRRFNRSTRPAPGR